MLFVFSMLVQLYLAAKKTINLELFRGCLVFKKPSLITPHSITHHLSLKMPQLLKVACLAFVSNFDNSFCGTHGLTWYSFYFLFLFFSFFLQPPIPKLTEPSEKEWGKKKRRRRRRRRRRIEKPSPDPTWKKKKKRRRRRRRPDRIWLLSDCGSLKYVYIYQNAIITLFS